MKLDLWEQASIKLKSRYEEFHQQKVIFNMSAILFPPLATVNLICQNATHNGNIDLAL